MRRSRMLAVLLAGSLALALTACNSDDPLAPDATGAVQGTDAQDSPQNLVVEILRLREEGHPEDAARYFVSDDTFQNWDDLEDLTEVDASTLCSSSTQSEHCTDNTPNSGYRAYADYLSGDNCPRTTSQKVQKEGVTDNGRPLKSGDRLVQAEVASAHPTEDGERGCSFNMVEVDGKWWIAN